MEQPQPQGQMRRRAKWPWLTWQTEYLDVRPLWLRDAVQVRDALQDSALREFQYSPKAPSLMGAVLFCLRAKWKMFRREALYYAQFMREDGRLASIEAVFGFDPYRPTVCEFGVWWLKELWGSPASRESNNGILSTLLYEEVGLRHFIFRVDERNTHVLRMLERGAAGFEGLHRDDRTGPDGFWSSYQWSSPVATPDRVRRSKTEHGWPTTPAYHVQ